MFTDIKFTSKVAPKDHNGFDLDIGDVVICINEYYRTLEVWCIIGLTNSEMFVWVSDGKQIKRRLPKNLIKIKDPKKFLRYR